MGPRSKAQYKARKAAAWDQPQQRRQQQIGSRSAIDLEGGEEEEEGEGDGVVRERRAAGREARGVGPVRGASRRHGGRRLLLAARLRFLLRQARQIPQIIRPPLLRWWMECAFRG
ncbi:hypothetical protein NL676_025339 [Syzygium grande]|nr:hypothetical protein NL676_025339 [Syzygium grande]